jgi:flagellar basal-body rod modification protein FlgD
MPAESIMTTPQIAPYSPKPKTVASGADNSELGKDAFLKLLVAQLKYQDPLAPTDSSALMQQSATYSMVENMQNMQAAIESSSMNSTSASATALLGKNVTALANDGKTNITGVVSGVRFTSDGPVLKIGNVEVPLGRVKEVRS